MHPAGAAGGGVVVSGHFVVAGIRSVRFVVFVSQFSSTLRESEWAIAAVGSGVESFERIIGMC